MKNSYKFFQNKDCDYFPCHKIDKDKLNCLFCYCPLYALKEDCGGNFKYIDDGIKDCSQCTVTHNGEKGWEYVINKIPKLIDISKKR